MGEYTPVRLQMGNVAGREFEEFWREEVDVGRIPPNLQATFTPGGGPPTGLGLSVPPEVWIALATGASSEIGKQLIVSVWNTLKRFFHMHSEKNLPLQITIIKGDVYVTLSPSTLIEADTPPPQLLENRSGP